MEKSQEISEFSLPPEIIFQILKELPVKSLLRLRCVSKLWCSIIDDPFFVQSHYTRSHTRPGGISILHCDHTCRLELADPEFDSVHLILNLPHTCFRNPQYHNGLICIDNCISNPSTRECIIIPPPLGSKTKASFEESSKELDPEYFLGFDPSSNKFKVLYRRSIITKLYNRIEYQYKILTLGTNSWRDIDGSITCRHSIICRSCSIAGFIYFIHADVLVAFDVRDEEFSLMYLPKGASLASFLIQFGERLAVMDFGRKTIWILEDCRKQLWNGQSLEMMYEGEPLINNNGLQVRPYGTIHTSEILVGFFSLYPHNWLNPEETAKLCFYDLGSKKLRILKTVLPNIDFYTKYVESLFRCEL